MNNCIKTKKGFTLAEVLITLGIIGVVAAMTLPALIENHKKTVTVNKVKKVYTEISQAIIRSEADNGSSEYWPLGAEMDTYDFYNKYWKPYYNHIELCATAVACGYDNNSPWKYLNGLPFQSWVLDTSSTRLLFRYGSGNIVFYPKSTMGKVGQRVYLDFFVVDINGPQRPNLFGIDVFMFKLSPGKGIVPSGFSLIGGNVDANCSFSGNGTYCVQKLLNDGWVMKKDYPWK